MKLPITLLVLAALGQAVDSKLPSASKTSDVNKSNKRDLLEGNYGLRNGLSYATRIGPAPGIEYADDKDNLPDKSIFSGRVPQIPKISDVLTGQGASFEEAVASHLYAPVSVYQPRLSSPTTFDNPSEASQLGYPEQKLYKQSQQYFQLFEQNPQNHEPKPGYLPEYTHGESKLLHLETAFPRLEPSYSTPAPLSQDLFGQPFSGIDPQLYPVQFGSPVQFSYRHVEQIPLRYPDGRIQPTQYVKQSMVKFFPVQHESDNGEASRNEDHQPTEGPHADVQISTEATQDFNAQPEPEPTYESLYQQQPSAQSQQYLPKPQLSHLQPQAQYQHSSVEESKPQPEDQQVQTQQQGDQYQQYEKSLQTQEQSPQTESSQQVVEITQTTPQPEREYQTTPEILEPKILEPIQPEPAQPETISTFKPISEYSTTPKLLEYEEPSTTVTPYTTYKPLSRMPMVPLRPLPGSRKLPQPRPFSNTLPTTALPTRFPTLSPLPTFRRHPHLKTRLPSFPTLSTTLSSLPTITTTPHPIPTEISSTQFLPSTTAVSRMPIIRIRYNPSYNQFQSTTPQPPRPDVTTLEPFSQPTSTFHHSTTLEHESQSDVQTVQQQQGSEYLPPPELPSRPQPGVMYHLQHQPLPISTPQPELLYPQPHHIQPPPPPQPHVYPQPSPPPQTYSQQVLIQPPRPHLQSFVPSEQFQLYEPPVFNLRPQYQPLSTPPPPLQPTELALPQAPQPQRQPRPDAQQPKKQKPLALKSKVLNGGETYFTPGSFVGQIQPVLHPQLYSQSHELFVHPDLHPLAAPTFPTVQYFGKYAEAIFGHYHH